MSVGRNIRKEGLTLSGADGEFVLVSGLTLWAAAAHLSVRHQVTAVTHIDIKHIPFALSILPFFAVGIASPITIQDWLHGRLMRGDGWTLLGGLLVVGAWESAILFSVKSKKRRGQERLLGRELSSWYWAPAITFAVGVVSGLIFIRS